MSTLGDAITAYLAGEKGLAALMTDLQNSRRDLSAHRDDISSILLNVPDFLIGVERDAWQAAFSKTEELLAEAEKEIQNRENIQVLGANLPRLSEELTMSALNLREAGWAARGPSSHGGANELLNLLAQFGEEPSDDLFDLLHLKLEVEFTRFEHQAQNYQNLPEFCANAMEELLPEYRDLLERITQLPELSTEEFDEIYEQLEAWAVNFSVYDLDFLVKRYSHVPTQIPTLNFALNCLLLYLDELVVEEMVDYAVGVAADTLQAGSDKFIQQHSLNPVSLQVYTEALENVLNELDNLGEVENKDELKEQGSELIRLAAIFVATQTKAETESGSRLDFKSEYSE